MVCSACATYRSPLAPPLTCLSNISAPPAPLTSVVAGARSITAACKSTSSFLCAPSCCFQGGHVSSACVCVSLEMPACHTLSRVQVSRRPDGTVQQVPAAATENSERILNHIKMLKLSMCPNGAGSFLSASLSLLAGGEEWEGPVCLPACLPAVGGATPAAPPLLGFLPSSGFLCLFLSSLLQRNCSWHSHPHPNRKPLFSF